MVHLINKNDKDVIAGSGFVKNAVFYKDMLAFYDAYSNLMQTKLKDLPSFCYKNGNFHLEGICLLFKDYASELGFESVKLSLDYLKVIYYTIASYSEKGELPDKTLLVNEFNVYKNASVELASSASVELESTKEEYLKAKEEFDDITSRYAKKLVSSNILGGFASFMIVFTIILAMLPYTCYHMGKFAFNTATIICFSVLFGGAVVCWLFKMLSKKSREKADDIKYEIQGIKKKKDNADLELSRVLDRYNKINSEKYEYSSNFAEELKKFVEILSFDDVVKRAAEYKMLSYNMKLDLENLFETQEKEIKDCIDRINNITKPETSEQEFEILYKEICEKDWLYYNNEIRFEFIKRMADVSEFSFNYTVSVDGKKINPFGISVKALSKEPIVYLKSNDDLFISATLDKFLNTKYIRSSKTLELKGLKGSEALKRAKMEFASHFFDYEGTIKYNNLFYATKLQDGVKIPQEIIEKNRKVPTFVYMKLKLIETRLGIGNSDASTIKQLAKIIRSFEETGNFEKIAVVDMRDEDTDVQVESESCIYEDLGYAVKYTFEDGSFIGYRLSNII